MHLNKLSLLERFWTQIDRKEDDECWNWTGNACDGSRYGSIHINGKSIKAHHAALLIIDGVDVPSGMVVCHTCDNTKCVNPNHLFLGTQSDNVHDMIKKGRMYYRAREQSPLNVEKVREIRQMAREGYMHKQIADKFNICTSAVTRIVNYHSWAEVDPHLKQQSSRVKSEQRIRKAA